MLAGYGSQIRDWICCLIVAYATQRTLIIESRGWQYAERGLETLFLPISTNCTFTYDRQVTERKDLSDIGNIPTVKLPRVYNLVKRPEYLPFSIPEDIADEIERVHKNPSVWWISQFSVYITRQNKMFSQYADQSIRALGFRRPIVGIHVRRTDKRTEAKYHNLSEYMSHVDAWFDNYEKRHRGVKRRVYLASDDPGVLISAKKRYPKYTFVSNDNASAMANDEAKRYSESSLRGIVLDIQMLSMCDFFVCTLSSSVGTLVYLKMHVHYWDAPERIKSLDIDYAFAWKFLGDKLFEKYRNNSYPKGMNIMRDASKNPTRKRISLDKRQSRVKMPRYREVPIWK